MIILGDFRIRAGVTSRRCYRSLVYQVRCRSRSVHIHSPRCPSMALLSLCIKPFSPITLTPRRSRLSASTSRNLLIFHDFIPAVSSRLQPLLRPVVADRVVSLARSLAREYFQDVSQNLYRPKGVGRGRGGDRGVGDGGGGQGGFREG